MKQERKAQLGGEDGRKKTAVKRKKIAVAKMKSHSSKSKNHVSKKGTNTSKTKTPVSKKDEQSLKPESSVIGSAQTLKKESLISKGTEHNSKKTAGALKTKSPSSPKTNTDFWHREINTGIHYTQGELLFAAAYILYLLRLLLANSTIQAYIPVGGRILNIVRITMLILIFVKCFWFDRVYRPKVLLKYMCMFCVLVVSVYYNQYKYLLDVGILLFGAQHVPLKKIVRLYFFTAGLAIAVFFVYSVTGLIENYYYDSIYVDRGARYAFGTLYATDFAAMLFYLLMSKYYISRKKVGFLYMVISCAIAVFIDIYCDARMNSALIVIFAVSAFIVDRWSFLINNPVSKGLLRWAMPLCCICVLALQVMYFWENETVILLDEMLSKRLGNSQQIIDEYGISLFGKNIVFRGNGWATVDKDLTLEYNYVDSGYMQMLFRYGVIILILYIVAHYFAVAYSQRNKKGYKLQLIILFISVSAMLEPRAILIVYNPFMFSMVASLEGRPKSRNTQVWTEG